MSCDSALAPATVRSAATAVDRPNHVAPDERGRPEPDQRNDQIEAADEAGGVEHGVAVSVAHVAAVAYKAKTLSNAA
jgi:hypothetical protein